MISLKAKKSISIGSEEVEGLVDKVLPSISSLLMMLDSLKKSNSSIALKLKKCHLMSLIYYD